MYAYAYIIYIYNNISHHDNNKKNYKKRFYILQYAIVEVSLH